MLAVGRVDEGVALLQRSTQLDPLSDLVNGDAALWLRQGWPGSGGVAGACSARRPSGLTLGVDPLRLNFLMAAIYFGTHPGPR